MAVLYWQREPMAAPVETKEDVLRLLRQQESQIRALGVQRLGLFGSFVRGQQTAASDVDILAEFERGQKSFDHFIQLCFLLEELLGRRVELVTPEGLSPHIAPRILAEVEHVALAV